MELHVARLVLLLGSLLADLSHSCGNQLTGRAPEDSRWTPPATQHGKKPEDTPSLQEGGCRPGRREPETPSLPETLQLGHRHSTRPESHVHRAPPHQVSHRGSAQPTSQETTSPLFMATADSDKVLC